MIVAPFGAGCYELRNGGRSVLFEASDLRSKRAEYLRDALCRNQTGTLPPIQVAAHQSDQLQEGWIWGKPFGPKVQPHAYFFSILPIALFWFRDAARSRKMPGNRLSAPAFER